MSVWKWVSESEVSSYLARRGLTIDQAKANLMRKLGYSEKKAIEELQIGPLCEQALEAMRLVARVQPEFFNDHKEDPFT